MSDHSTSRRAALRGLGYVLGAGVIGLDWPAIARAAHEAHQVAQSTAPPTFTLLGPADAADVEALAAQIVPTDDTPGAREAGAAIFIDRALATFFAHWRENFMDGLRGFQADCHAANPDAASFASLPSPRQIDFLHSVQTTPFFDLARVLTLCGMFASPKYGGNRDGIGWKLIGFEDQHVFEPPFGYYDRGHEDGDVQAGAP